jgi:hydrogenase maturation protein HypF
LLYALGLDWDEALPTHEDLCYEDRLAILTQLQHKLNSPLTSSMGRLFDAAAALAGVRQQVNYEAQAAIEFEALADPDEQDQYAFNVSDKSPVLSVDLHDAIQSLVADVLSGIPTEKISARFHNGLARMVTDVCLRLSDQYDLSEVALSGGVWQNMTLLQKTLALLEREGFTVYVHSQVPTNDGGLALGQAVIAAWKIKANHEGAKTPRN